MKTKILSVSMVLFTLFTISGCGFTYYSNSDGIDYGNNRYYRNRARTLSERQFRSLYYQIEGAYNSRDLLAYIHRYYRHYSFYTDQVAHIAALGRSDRERLVVLEYLYPRIIDKRNSLRLINLLRSSDARDRFYYNILDPNYRRNSYGYGNEYVPQYRNYEYQSRPYTYFEYGHSGYNERPIPEENRYQRHYYGRAPKDINYEHREKIQKHSSFRDLNRSKSNRRTESYGANNVNKQSKKYHIYQKNFERKQKEKSETIHSKERINRVEHNKDKSKNARQRARDKK